MRLTRLIPLGLLALALVLPAIALAQAYPAKSLRWVVPFAPGGGSDIIARTVGQRLSERLGQPVVIENRPGATTTIGADAVARSAPDGYTLLLAPSASVIAQYVVAKLAYTEKDFAAVTLLGHAPMILAVHPSVPARTLGDLVALARAKPGVLTYASPGSGSVPHMTGELFKLRARIDLLHVPYKGGGPAVADLVGGQVSMTFATPPELLPHIRSGKLAPIAAAALARMAQLPDVPTIHESGYPNFEVLAWFGVLVRAGTPAEIVGRLANEFNAVLKLPDVAERLTGQGMEIAGTSPEEFARFLRAEHAKWSEAVRAAGVKLD